MSYLLGHWQITGMLQRISRQGNRLLLLQCNPASSGNWIATGVETRDSGTTDVLEGAKNALDHHSHKILGEFPSVQGALKACDSFAKIWAKSKSFEECACDEIAVSP